MEINTKVTVGESYGRGLGNLILEDARFFGRPNFSGEMNQFKEDKRQFTVLIPNDVADTLRELGWNVKTTIPRTEEEEPLSHLKVMVDLMKVKDYNALPEHEKAEALSKGPDIRILQGDQQERLGLLTAGVLDRSRLETIDMEIRAWMYNGAEVAQGLEEPKYSARLVALVATLRPSLLDSKYGRLS